MGSKLLPATPPVGTSWLSGQLSVLNTPCSVCRTSSLHRQAHGEGTETWGTGRPVLSLSSSGLLQGRRFWEQGCRGGGGGTWCLCPPLRPSSFLPSLLVLKAKEEAKSPGGEALGAPPPGPAGGSMCIGETRPEQVPLRASPNPQAGG